MNTPKISIIIPTWNSEKTLRATIKSCLNQTLEPFEVLVCDDGSTDNSKKVVEDINDPRVIWVPHQHTGTPAIPRNNGMRVSSGDWIAFCDSDDEWLPEKLEKQIQYLSKSKNKAVCTNAIIKINENITSKKMLNFKKSNISTDNLIWNNNIICSSVIINKSIYNKIGGFPEDTKYAGFEDYVYWLKVSTETDLSFLDENLVIYYDHPKTSIRSKQIPDTDIKKLSLESFILFIKKDEVKYLSYKHKILLYKTILFIKKTIKSIIK